MSDTADAGNAGTTTTAETAPPEGAETPATPAPDTPDAAAVAAAQAAAASGATAEAEAEADPFDNPDATTFPREYVEKLRQEAAKHRTEAAPFKEAFDGFAEPEVKFFVDLAQGLKGDDASVEAAAQRMLTTAQSILGIDPNAPKDGDAPDPNAPLTRADLDKIEAERTAKAQEAAAVAAVEAEAKELGYADPKSADYADLMWRAVNTHKGDLKAAHEARAAERQGIIDSYLADLKEKGQAFPKVPGSNGTGEPAADPTGGAPKTWAESRKAAESRLGAAIGK